MSGSGENWLQHVTMHIGQSMVAAAMAESQAFVVDAQLVQQRSMDVVNVYGIADDAVAKLVGLSIGDTTFEAATGHENAVAIHVMITACGITDSRCVRCASHLTSPEDDRLFQQAALFQVRNQCGDTLFCDPCIFLVVLFQ